MRNYEANLHRIASLNDFLPYHLGLSFEHKAPKKKSTQQKKKEKKGRRKPLPHYFFFYGRNAPFHSIRAIGHVIHILVLQTRLAGKLVMIGKMST